MSGLNAAERIVILDFGSQYSQLIARRIRECGVFSEIIPYYTPLSQIKNMSPVGIVLSGGPASVLAKGSPRCDPAIFDIGVPVLGICYGVQLMVKTLGGRVTPSKVREYGRTTLAVGSKGALFSGINEKRFTVWMSHGDKVEKLPHGFKPLASTGDTEYAAVGNPARRLYGIQFHPEVVHTSHGKDILLNFCRDVCGSKLSWTMRSYMNVAVKEIRAAVGKERVILGLSGGVDSSVAAALIHKAIGDQLTCIFVNNGLLRKGEAEKVRSVFAGHFNIKLKYVDAERRFLSKLAGVSEPEKKRKIIGHEFVKVFEEATTSLKNATFLAQGTTYPDVIESVSINGNPSSMIKSHHNVGGLPKNMRLRLLEPLRHLFKDEVRELGRQLKLPEEIVMRQPFPGARAGGQDDWPCREIGIECPARG